MGPRQLAASAACITSTLVRIEVLTELLEVASVHIYASLQSAWAHAGQLDALTHWSLSSGPTGMSVRMLPICDRQV